jgi:hypothetical protein
VLAEEAQLAALVGVSEFLDEAAPEQPREHPHGKEEARPAGDPGLAVRCEPATRDDTVHMRVVGQRRPPGVQHQRGADACAKVLRIRSDAHQHFGRHIEQQPVDDGLVLVREIGDRRRKREDHVVILDRQQITLAGFEPTLRRTALALRTMAVTARVVGDLVGTATFAPQDMTTERRAAALFDGRHDLELTQAQVAALTLAPGRAVDAEDVGDLQGGVRHSPMGASGSPAD